MKTRLLGAAVIIALLVLFVPMFFPSHPPAAPGDQSVSLAIPPAPDRDLQTRTMSLNPDASAPAVPGSAAGATVIPAAGNGSSDQLATVNIASRRPTDVETGGAGASATAPAAAPAPPPSATEPVIQPQPPAPKASAQPRPVQAASAGKPAVAGEAAMPPATAARGSYTINLSAYASSTGATTLMHKVRALGYPVRSHVIRQGGKSLTAVEAGPFPTRTAAEAARLKITQSIAGVPAKLESSASTPSGDEPARAAGSTRAGGWAVQVAAMSSRTEALALRDKLRTGGFDGFVDSVTVGGRTLWRVRAGPQTQRDDALRVREQIRSKLGLSGNVVSVP
ncbi:MAG: SPOR domain-containing protein [Xanthomonadaceae bacterium]|nr:SPOR domain-containing protein [Xanthomonadaceae bacterium]